ncbi:MAG: hypothetical protein AAGC55_08120, partial [Myxococcota bacterium]
MPHGPQLVAHGEQTDQHGFGLIAVPTWSEPVLVQWRYVLWSDQMLPGAESAHALGIFVHGDEQLQVRERYEDLCVGAGEVFRARRRHSGAAMVGCSELAAVLAIGEPIVMRSITYGAYRGLWRGDIYFERRHPTDALAPQLAARVAPGQQ